TRFSRDWSSDVCSSDLDLKTGIVDTIAGTGERKLPKSGTAAKGQPIYGPRALFIDGDTMWIALREGNTIWRMNLNDGIIHHVAEIGRASCRERGWSVAV